MAETQFKAEQAEFSLVVGGPLYRLFCRSHLCDAGLRPVYRRTLAVTAIAWVPLFILSLIDGRALGDMTVTPFLYDITAQVRFLVAVPALLIAESTAHALIVPRIKEFVTRNIIRRDDLPAFAAAVGSAGRMRDSKALEIGLIVLVYTLGLWIWRTKMAFASPTWYAAPDSTGLNLTHAGYWLILVSVPIFQFLILRWYVRFVIWFVFLLRVSRLDLNLVATHSDRAAGIGFLAQCAYGFTGVLFAQGALLSADIANGVIHTGRNLLDHKFEPFVFVLIFLAVVLGPLAVFAPVLIRAKWRALLVYGSLASQYVEDFDNKWVGGVNPAGEALLGTGDIQSLADLSNSYSVLQSMRMVPFDLKDVLWLLGVTAAPLLPLFFFIFSLEEMLDKLVTVLI